MTPTPPPLPLPPFLDYVLDIAKRYESQIGISTDEVAHLRSALNEGLRPSNSYRDGFNEDHYVVQPVHLYVRADLITLMKEGVVVTGSLARQQLSIRAPRKHPQFGYEVDTVMAVEPFPVEEDNQKTDTY